MWCQHRSRERCAAIQDFPEADLVALEHLVLSHQGRLEYGSPTEPRTAEALALHMIDNLDSKLAQLRELSSSEGGFQYVRGLGRHMLLAGSENNKEEAEAAADGPEQLEL